MSFVSHEPQQIKITPSPLLSYQEITDTSLITIIVAIKDLMLQRKINRALLKVFQYCNKFPVLIMEKV